MAINDNRKFLSLDGLNILWGIINSKFVSNVSLDTDSDGVKVTVTKGDGTSATSDVVIGLASKDNDKPGLMTQEQATIVANFAEGVAAVAPFASLKIGTNETLLTDRTASIDLVYSSDEKQIQVVDRNNVVEGKATVLTYIDATEFITDGMLADAELVDKTVDGVSKKFLVLSFNTEDENGVSKTPVELDVTELIDIYTATADGGIGMTGNAFYIKIATPAGGNKNYLATSANGLTTTDALVTDYTNAATNAAATAEGRANDYTDEKIAELTDEATGILITAKNYIDGEIDKIEAVIGKKAVGDDDASGLYKYIDDAVSEATNAATTAAATAEENAKKHADNKIEELSKEDGAITVAFNTAKKYTDETVEAATKAVNEKYDGVIGKPASGDDAATGLYADIAAAAKAGTDAAADALADAKTYTDNEIQKLDFTDTAEENKFVTSVSQVDGVISVTRAGISIDQVSGWTIISEDDIYDLCGVEKPKAE